MNNTFKWVTFLVIGVVLGFMFSLLFNNGDDVASKAPPAQPVEEVASTDEPKVSTENAKIENSTASNIADNILVRKGCVACHAVSPLEMKGNGTGPDLAIAYEDVTKRFGKSLEEFLNEPEGTMSAILSASPLAEEEKQEIISLLKEYSGQ